MRVYTHMENYRVLYRLISGHIRPYLYGTITHTRKDNIHLHTERYKAEQSRGRIAHDSHHTEQSYARNNRTETLGLLGIIL